MNAVNTDRADSDSGSMGRMTEKDFAEWSQSRELVRAEWIDGQVMKMASTSDEHDALQWWCRTLIQVFVESRRLGTVHGPNFQMRLAAQRQRRAPDVLFVATARQKQLRPNYLDGPADLVIEIIAPDSRKRDRRDKFEVYQAAGVKEYWLVDPLDESLDAFTLAGDKYRPMSNLDGTLNSVLLSGLHIRPRWLWPIESRAIITDALNELGVIDAAAPTA
jgi:Uma2 family endonuclease